MTVEATSPNGAPATFSVSASDAVGVVGSVSCDAVSGAIFPFGTTIVACSASDAAGNTGSASFNVTVQDTIAPAITINAPVHTSYVLNSTANASYSCTDSGSGVNSCTGTVANGAAIDTSSVGPKAFTVNANDKKGNASSSTVNYIVQYASTGTCMGAPGHQILQPINADGSSVFKQGSTVPAKFRVCDANGTSINTPGLVTSFSLTGKTTTSSSIAVNEPVFSTTPDAAFRWDASSQQWIFNINTRNMSSMTKYTYTITLNDGSTIVFSFNLK